MKSKFLDMHNCNFLLPKFFVVSVLRDFDSYLDELNAYSNHKGIVDRLITHNQKTQGSKNFWDRLLRYDIDVLVTLDATNRHVRKEILDNYAFPENARTGANQRVLGQFSYLYRDGTRWTGKLPLQSLLKGWGDANEGYQCYVHTIKYGPDPTKTTDASGTKAKEMHYSGITGRNWLQRLDEHMNEVRHGGNKLFHRAWRESMSGKNMIYVSELMKLNASFEAAMAWEEFFVDKWSLAPKGFNMIPGGFKGLKFLHEQRITDRVVISLEERDRAIVEYVRQNPRKGIPNPFLSELWKDDEFYLRVIGAKEKTLTPNQVRQIRALHNMGRSVPEIAKEVDALNEAQVKNVISGRTYKRIH